MGHGWYSLGASFPLNFDLGLEQTHCPSIAVPLLYSIFPLDTSNRYMYMQAGTLGNGQITLKVLCIQLQVSLSKFIGQKFEPLAWYNICLWQIP